MSERFRCVFIGQDGKILNDKFIRNLRPFEARRTFINCLSQVSDKYEDNRYKQGGKLLECSKNEVYQDIMNLFYTKTSADEFDIDPLQLDGIYFIDFQKMEIELGFCGEHKCVKKQSDDFYNFLNSYNWMQPTEEEQETYNRLNNLLHKKIDQITHSVNGFRNWYNFIDDKMNVYNFRADIFECFEWNIKAFNHNYNHNANVKIAKQLIKLAKSLVARQVYEVSSIQYSFDLKKLQSRANGIAKYGELYSFQIGAIISYDKRCYGEMSAIQDVGNMKERIERINSSYIGDVIVENLKQDDSCYKFLILIEEFAGWEDENQQDPEEKIQEFFNQQKNSFEIIKL